MLNISKLIYYHHLQIRTIISKWFDLLGNNKSMDIAYSYSLDLNIK